MQRELWGDSIFSEKVAGADFLLPPVASYEIGPLYELKENP